MKPSTDVLDVEALKSYVSRNGTWAVESGLRVSKMRQKQTGLEVAQFADRCGVSATTMKSIEAGQLVPREYLRAVIAWHVGRDVDDLWPPLRRQQISDLAGPVVAA